MTRAISGLDLGAPREASTIRAADRDFPEFGWVEDSARKFGQRFGSQAAFDRIRQKVAFGTRCSSNRSGLAQTITANRANAKRSTGPRSSGGKAHSKRNAVTHGLTAPDIVVVNEQPEKLEAFREDLMADFEPDSALERELVDRLAGLLWRLRVPVAEAKLLNKLSSRPYGINIKTSCGTPRHVR